MDYQIQYILYYYDLYLNLLDYLIYLNYIYRPNYNI